jgi:NADH-quinone oxidoreductase subunit N
MDYSSLQTLAESQSWSTILPEIILAVGGLLLLLLDVIIPRKLNSILAYASMAIAAAVLVLMAYTNCMSCSFSDSGAAFGGMIKTDALANWFRFYFVVTYIGVAWVALNYFKGRELVRTEFFAVSSIVTSAFMMLALSQHFVMVFVSLETIAIGLYVLVAYDRNSKPSLEAGIKYLVMGGTNTAILLLGIVLVYGIAGNPSLDGASKDPLLFSNLSEFVAINADNLVLKFAVLAILASVAFKIGLVPFQIWIPDVYQGAPTPTTALLSISSKTGGFVVLFLLFGREGVFEAMNAFVLPILLVATIISLLYGNLTALGYTNVKRLLGMSGVSHAGFLMIGFLVLMTGSTESWIVGAILFYLAVYLIASLVVFGVMTLVSGKEDHNQDVYDYTDLAKSQPFLAAMLTIGVGSMAGIPPLAGFVAKFALFVAAFKSGLYLLLAIAAASVVISIFYYFKWIREAYFKDPLAGIDGEEETKEAKPEIRMDLLSRVFMFVLAGTVIVLGVYPMGLLSAWSF